ncbi:hypothetical protein GGF42_005466, partial [Coemansia sp. RSA 2424]
MKYSYSVALVATMLTLLTNTSNGQKFITKLSSNQKPDGCTDCLYPQYSIRGAPVRDMNSWDMACRSPDMKTKPKPFSINSDNVLLIGFDKDPLMDIISKDKKGEHILGPCVVYMAEATDKKLKWFKAFEYAGNEKKWCSEMVAEQDVLRVPMKPELKDGDYVVRAEIIGLNMADKKS